MTQSGINMSFDTLGMADDAAKCEEIRWGNSFSEVTTTNPPAKAGIHICGPGATIGPVTANAANIS